MNHALLATALVLTASAFIAPAPARAQATKPTATTQATATTHPSVATQPAATTQPAAATQATATTHRSVTTPSVAGTQPSAATQHGAAARSGAADKPFVARALAGGRAQVEAAQLAGERATDADLKTFAARVAQERAKLDQRLAELAEQKQLRLPRERTQKHKSVLERLEKLEGSPFDRALASFLARDTEEAVALFRSASHDVTDETLRHFAADATAVLEQHLSTARALAKRLYAPTTPATKPAKPTGGDMMMGS